MNNNPDAVTAGDLVFLALCIVGFLTGLAGVLTVTAWAGALGLILLIVGMIYFSAVQAVDA